jgi:Transglycosylase SLT domain
MAHTSEIDDIPPSQVDQVVQDFKDAGATSVTKTQQPNGNFSVIATFDGGGPIVQPPPEISLSWDNVPERKAWSAQLVASLNESKSQLDQGNPNAFLDGYSALSPALQIKFWAELLVAVAKFESSWNPHDIYDEPPPLNVESVGLLQLSYQDQAGYELEPLSQAAKSLEDPLMNLRCGVKIFATLLARDRTVASSSHGYHRGAAAYWSVLRAGHKVDQIIALTKKNVGL